MHDTVTELRHRLRYVIHLGLVDIRNLAYASGFDAQIADLADILEFLPRFLEDDREPDLEVIREQFDGYKARHPKSRYDYVGYLEGRLDIPDY